MYTRSRRLILVIAIVQAIRSLEIIPLETLQSEPSMSHRTGNPEHLFLASVSTHLPSDRSRTNASWTKARFFVANDPPTKGAGNLKIRTSTSKLDFQYRCPI